MADRNSDDEYVSIRKETHHDLKEESYCLSYISGIIEELSENDELSEQFIDLIEEAEETYDIRMNLL